MTLLVMVWAARAKKLNFKKMDSGILTSNYAAWRVVMVRVARAKKINYKTIVFEYLNRGAA